MKTLRISRLARRSSHAARPYRTFGKMSKSFGLRWNGFQILVYAKTPYAGVRGHRPPSNKSGPPLRTNSDYPRNGDKRVSDLETVLRLCRLRDGMTISGHLHLCNG